MFLVPRYLGCVSSVPSPLTLPGSDALESWHRSDQGITIGATLKRGGTTPPADITITSGNRQQSIGLVIKITGAGVRGVATYEAYSDGGVGSPFQSGVTAASVVLTAVGLTVSMPAGTYATDNVYEGVVESWANLTPKTRTLVSIGAVSAQPTIIPAAQNNRPTIHSDGGTTGYLQDITSDWAASVASGNDSDFSGLVVCKTDSAVPSSIRTYLSFINQGSANPGWLLGIRNGTNNYRSTKVDDAGSAQNADGGALDTSYHVLSFIQSGTTISLSDNGTVLYSGSAQNVGATTLDAVALFNFPRGGVAANAMIGAVGEAMTWNRALSSSDMATLIQYARAGWGL